MPTALITGANRGIGLELTRRYLNRDWRVIAVNRSRSDELQSLAPVEKLLIIQGDLTDEDFLEGLSDILAKESLDLVINNAGIMGTSTFGESGSATVTTTARDGKARLPGCGGALSAVSALSKVSSTSVAAVVPTLVHSTRTSTVSPGAKGPAGAEALTCRSGSADTPSEAVAPSFDGSRSPAAPVTSASTVSGFQVCA